MAERVGMYREGIKHAQPVGSFINNQIAALSVTHCADTDGEAHEFAGPEGVWFVNMAEKLYAPWTPRGDRTPGELKTKSSTRQGVRE